MRAVPHRLLAVGAGAVLVDVIADVNDEIEIGTLGDPADVAAEQAVYEARARHDRDAQWIDGASRQRPRATDRRVVTVR